MCRALIFSMCYARAVAGAGDPTVQDSIRRRAGVVLLITDRSAAQSVGAAPTDRPEDGLCDRR